MLLRRYDSTGKILVTGASGFIGRHICNIVENKVSVARNNKFLSHDDFLIKSNIDASTDWAGDLSSVDSIIHCASIVHDINYSSNDIYSVNVEGTLNLARSAVYQGVRRFVFVSSIGVNGFATFGKPFSHLSAYSPYDLYTKSKHLAELGLKRIADETGLELVIVRPTLVYGFNTSGSFNKFLRFISMSPILPFGNCINRRSFVSVFNLADLLVNCAIAKHGSGSIFLASDFKVISMKDFSNEIANCLGMSKFQVPFPNKIFQHFCNYTNNNRLFYQIFGDLEVDNQSIIDVLKWSPSYSISDTFSKNL